MRNVPTAFSGRRAARHWSPSSLRHLSYLTTSRAFDHELSNAHPQPVAGERACEDNTSSANDERHSLRFRLRSDIRPHSECHEGEMRDESGGRHNEVSHLRL